MDSIYSLTDRWVIELSNKPVFTWVTLITLLSILASTAFCYLIYFWIKPALLVEKITLLLPIVTPVIIAPPVAAFFHFLIKSLVGMRAKLSIQAEAFEKLASVDALTNVANRRFWIQLAEQEIARTRRYNRPLSIIMLDLDHFKSINDSFGHHVGDIVLQRLCEVCSKFLREVDVIGRIGGEEFAILMPETEGGHALDATERLRQAIEEMEMHIEKGKTLRFTASFGVTALVETDTDIDKILIRADRALYQAKHAGRNRVCMS
jgi:diguanylate cyclase (GGDEF)-like protein